MKTTTILLFISLWAFSFVVHGQGFIVDEDYSTIPFFKSPDSGEKFGNKLADKEDLTEKVHVRIMNQHGLLNCLPTSIYSYAYTIQRAYIDKETDLININEKTLSGIFPYILMTNGECKSAILVNTLIKFDSTRGNLKYSDFPYFDCKTRITPEMEEKAKKNRTIKNLEKIFVKPHSENPKSIIKAIKEQLNRNKRPVVFGMIVSSERFKTINRTNNIYDRQKHGRQISGGEGHAMTIVGYDEYKKAFKILNSWGEDFGIDGYFWMKYDDFLKEALVGFILDLYDNEPSDPGKDKNTLHGQSFFLHEDEKEGKLKIVNALSHKGGGVYELNKKDWKKGDEFQLQINNEQNGKSIFAFSIDNKQNVTLHWPFQSMGELISNPPVDMNESTIYIPSKGERMDIQEPGDDYLCVLYSNKPLLPDMPGIINKINQSKEKDVVKKIQNALGTKLITDVEYQANDLSFKANSKQDGIVMLILKVHSVSK